MWNVVTIGRRVYVKPQTEPETERASKWAKKHNGLSGTQHLLAQPEHALGYSSVSMNDLSFCDQMQVRSGFSLVRLLRVNSSFRVDIERWRVKSMESGNPSEGMRSLHGNAHMFLFL